MPFLSEIRLHVDAMDIMRSPTISYKHAHVFIAYCVATYQLLFLCILNVPLSIGILLDIFCYGK